MHVVIHVVLVAHGSRDPRAAVTVRAITRAVTAARPGAVVHDAYLDFDAPHLAAVLAELCGHGDRIIVVPLLLSSAYHARTDIPGIVAAAGGRIDVTDVLTGDAVLDALRRRLGDVSVAGGGFDGLVLAAAGTSNVTALRAIDGIAAQLGRAESVPCLAGYASGAGRSVSDAIGQLRADGAERIALAPYFLAPGVLHDRVRNAAEASGVVAMSPPLGGAPEIVGLITDRIDQAVCDALTLVAI